MTGRVSPDWRVPSSEWDVWLEYLADNYGESKGYKGQWTQRAMVEWMDEDEFAELDGLVKAVIRQAGADIRGTTENKKLLAKSFDADEKTRVSINIEQWVYDKFRAYVDKHTDDSYGVALTRAIRAFRDGGRAERLKRWCTNALDDMDGSGTPTSTETIDAKDDSVSGDEDEDESDIPEEIRGLAKNSQKRRAWEYSQELGDQFTREELDEAIDATTDSTLETYRELITDQLDVVPHPLKNHLYIPREMAEDIANDEDVDGPDAPAIDRKPYGDMNPDERKESVHIALARKAKERSNNRYQFSTEDIYDDVFEGVASKQACRNLKQKCAQRDGFRIRTSAGGGKRLAVNLNEVDSSLLEDAGIAEDSGEQSREDIAQEADEMFDALMTTGGNTDSKGIDPAIEMKSEVAVS